MIRIAKGMFASLLVMGLPVIVTEYTRKSRQDPNSIHCFTSTLGMLIEIRPLIITSRAQSQSLTIYIDASLISINARTFNEF